MWNSLSHSSFKRNSCRNNVATQCSNCRHFVRVYFFPHYIYLVCLIDFFSQSDIMRINFTEKVKLLLQLVKDKPKNNTKKKLAIYLHKIVIIDVNTSSETIPLKYRRGNETENEKRHRHASSRYRHATNDTRHRHRHASLRYRLARYDTRHRSSSSTRDMRHPTPIIIITFWPKILNEMRHRHASLRYRLATYDTNTGHRHRHVTCDTRHPSSSSLFGL